MVKPHDPDWNWGETYSAQVLEVSSNIVHLKIRRHDGQAITCSWEVLQRIKSEMLGADALAIEFYPPESNVVNESNLRHLWIFPESIISVEALPLKRV